MIPITPDFEVLPAERISENRSHESINFSPCWYPTSPKMNELRARHQAVKLLEINLTPVRPVRKI